jgi:hypothetical protein
MPLYQPVTPSHLESPNHVLCQQVCSHVIPARPKVTSSFRCDSGQIVDTNVPRWCHDDRRNLQKNPRSVELSQDRRGRRSWAWMVPAVRHLVGRTCQLKRLEESSDLTGWEGSRARLMRERTLVPIVRTLTAECYAPISGDRCGLPEQLFDPMSLVIPP